MGNSINLLNFVPSKFGSSQIFIDYLAALGDELSSITNANKLYNMSSWLDLIDDLEDFFDPAKVNILYLRNLAALIGLSLPPEDSTTESILRASVIEAIDWYKIKGTYQSLQVIAVINQMTFNIWDMYTNDYIIFKITEWFVGSEDENPVAFPFSSGYYKSPHFGLEVVLNKVYDPDASIGAPNDHLWDESYWPNIQTDVEKTRPAHTVPHYMLLLNPQTDINGSITTVDGDIHTQALLDDGFGGFFFDGQDATPADSWTFDEDINSDGISDITFDASFLSTFDRIDSWKLGVGNKNAVLNSFGTLVAYYKMNDSTSSTIVLDSSGNEVNGTSQQNTNIINVTGKVDGALSFNGSSDYIDTNNTFQSTFRDSFSIVLWIKPDDGHAPLTYFLFGANDGGNNESLQLKVTNTGEIAALYGAGGTFVDAETVDTVFVDGAETWHLAVFVFDNVAKQISIYFDDVLQTLNIAKDGDMTGITMADYAAGGRNLYLGSRNLNGSTSTFFAGDLDNLMVFNKTLSASERTALYNNGSGVNVANIFEDTNPLTGTLTSNNITEFDDRVEITFTIPKATNLSGVSELGICADTGEVTEELAIISVFPDIFKETESELRVLIILTKT